MKHVLYALMENKPGVLRRISGLFGRRGYNIDSIVASATEDENVTSMTIVVDGDEYILDQVIKQLVKLQEIIEAVSYTHLDVYKRQIQENIPMLYMHELVQHNIFDFSGRQPVFQSAGKVDATSEKPPCKRAVDAEMCIRDSYSSVR